MVIRIHRRNNLAHWPLMACACRGGPWVGTADESVRKRENGALKGPAARVTKGEIDEFGQKNEK